MKKVLRLLLPPLLVIVAVWIAVIIWWRISNRLPDGADVLLWLVALPLGLLLGYGFLKRFFDVLKRALSALLSGAVTSSAAVAADSAMATGAAEQSRSFVLHLLGGGVLLPHADSVSGVFDQLDEPEFAPSTDAQLQDEQGKPLLVTAVPDLDVAAARDALLEISGQAFQSELASGLTRSVAMAAQVLEQTQRQADTWSSSNAHLQVICLLPSAWAETHRSLVAVWVRQQLLQSGWAKERLSVSVSMTQGEADVLAQLDRCNELFNQQQGNQIGLLLAMSSWLDPHALTLTPNRWFSARNSKGVVPGEGAAAILFTRAGNSLQPPPEADRMTVLHRAALGKRDKSASASGLISAELLKDLARQAVQVAQTSMTEVVRVLTDVDHRGSRLQEISSVVSALQAPDADAIPLGRVGASIGQAGAATSLATLLAAHHAAINECKSVLLLSAPDDFERAAVVVRPLPSVVAAV